MKRKKKKNNSYYCVVYTSGKNRGTYIVVDTWFRCSQLIKGNANIYKKFNSKDNATTWGKQKSNGLQTLDQAYLVDDLLDNPWRDKFYQYSTKNWKY